MLTRSHAFIACRRCIARSCPAVSALSISISDQLLLACQSERTQHSTHARKRHERLDYASLYLLQVTMLNVTTPSTVPPSFTVTAVGNYTEGNAVLTVATNATASVSYLVMLGQDAAEPSAAQVCTLTKPRIAKEISLVLCIALPSHAALHICFDSQFVCL